ncbi:MAG: 16S rRNA (uracil(1498)-N(3))-methyltransferase, partial [Lachnospiraceae bacterium]|nr:16S rRNA (uracil(1498)-N(3))-methyltransferase [Lachnospiraceae bacterium]
MPRFYYEPSEKQGNRIVMTGEDVNHIKNVLRSRVGEIFTLCDGMGTDCEAKITDISERNSVTFEALSEKPSDTELPVRIVLYQGIPKKDKMELIIQKAVELGAAGVVPVLRQRCPVRLSDPDAARKRERWQRIAHEACKQSGRTVEPVVSLPLSLSAALREIGTCDAAAVPWEEEKA